jgi:hypothetical protein
MVANRSAAALVSPTVPRFTRGMISGACLRVRRIFFIGDALQLARHIAENF